MAYVPGFEYDVFISYRHIDNDFSWVTKLDETLQKLLRQHQRPVPEQDRVAPWDAYRVFRDNREIGGNNALSEMLCAAARSSATLVIVMSENYLAADSNWCHRERELFFESLRNSPWYENRVFIVRMQDVSEQRWPRELQQFVGYPFHQPSPNSNASQPIAFDFESTGVVHPNCQRLGDDVYKTLQRMRNDSLKSATPARVALPELPSSPGLPRSTNSSPTVFLAEVTDELHKELREFRSYLEQQGLSVVPATSRQFRWDFTGAQGELVPLLNSSTLVVQLLGKSPIPSDEQFAPGIEAWLAKRAEAAGKKPGQSLLRWRQFGTKEADYPDEAHRAVVFAPDVIAEDLARFKQKVVERARDLTRQKAVVGKKARVIVAAKKTHKPLADEVGDEIESQIPTSADGIESALLLEESIPIHQKAKDFESREVLTQALIVVHADADEDWVQNRMRECRAFQLSKRPNPPPCAVVVKPPDDRPHPETTPPRFDVIPHDDKTRLREFLAQIGPGVRS